VLLNKGKKWQGSALNAILKTQIPLITMEYISGQDLKGLIRQTGKLTIGKALLWP